MRPRRNPRSVTGVDEKAPDCSRGYRRIGGTGASPSSPPSPHRALTNHIRSPGGVRWHSLVRVLAASPVRNQQRTIQPCSGVGDARSGGSAGHRSCRGLGSPRRGDNRLRWAQLGREVGQRRPCRPRAAEVTCWRDSYPAPLIGSSRTACPSRRTRRGSHSGMSTSSPRQHPETMRNVGAYPPCNSGLSLAQVPPRPYPLKNSG